MDALLYTYVHLFPLRQVRHKAHRPTKVQCLQQQDVSGHKPDFDSPSESFCLQKNPNFVCTLTMDIHARGDDAATATEIHESLK